MVRSFDGEFVAVVASGFRRSAVVVRRAWERRGVG